MPGRIDTFRIPTRIQIGRGVSLTVATPLQQVGAKKVLLVTDPGVVKAGLVGPIEEKLREAKIPYEIYAEVVPDPGVAEVQRAYERAKAVGGLSQDIGRAVGACGYKENEKHTEAVGLFDQQNFKRGKLGIGF